MPECPYLSNTFDMIRSSREAWSPIRPLGSARLRSLDKVIEGSHAAVVATALLLTSAEAIMADQEGRFGQVPESMREMAQTSVAQARRALEEFMAAAQRTASEMEGRAEAVQAGARDISRKAVGYAEENVRTAFDFAERLVRAKDMQEIVSLQQEFLRTQAERFRSQLQEVGETTKQRTSAAARGTEGTKSKG